MPNSIRFPSIVSGFLTVVGASLSGSLSAQAPIPANIVSWWRAEADATDSVGSNDGVLQNGATVVPGFVGNAFAFADANPGVPSTTVNYIEIPDHPSLDFGEDPFTYEMWFKSTSTDPGVLLTKFDSQELPFIDILDDYVAIIMDASGQLEFRFTDLQTRSGQSAISPLPYNDGQWHHVAAVRSSASEAQLHVDGIEVDCITNIQDVNLDTNGGILMGSFRYGTRLVGVWQGLLDEVTIYDRALSPVEIQAIVAAGTTGKGIDADGDGLFDAEEAALGTDPNNPDSDGDMLFDGTEVDMQRTSTAAGCPNPLDPDSDGDTLLDGAEVTITGTDPCDGDTDGDGLPDALDPNPIDPGITGSVLVDTGIDLAAYIASRDAPLFDAPNTNAQQGRRNSLSTRLRNATRRITRGDYPAAIALLRGIVDVTDGDPQQRDWVVPSAERNLIHDTALALILLLSS